MKSKFAILAAVLLISTSILAQNISDGITHMHAQRFKSAQATFESLISKNPNNIEATYWLGQTYIEMDDSAGAKALYEKALMANGNAPLLLVGMGHVELYFNKKDEARQRFETALNLSKSRKGNDPDVLNAIGRANVDAKPGDVVYAIAKLNEAVTRDDSKNPNPDIYLNLGNAYRKAHDGSNAVVSYNKALEVNPNFAPALYRKAMIWNTQKNWEVYTRDLQAAIQKDPKFAPAYYELYYYNLGKLDFTQAADYANKFIANADNDIQNDYLRLQTLYVQKKYDEAISGAKALVNAAGAQTKPRTYRLLAYSHVENGDTAGAKTYIDEFFAKANDEEIVGNDLVLKGKIYGAVSGDPYIVFNSYKEAANMDTVKESRTAILEEGKNYFKEKGNKVMEAEMSLLDYSLNGGTDIAALFNTGVTLYQGQAFERADSIFQLYTKAYPDSIYGYLWSAYSNAAIDTTMEEGRAVPAYKKLLNVASKDKERYKTQGISASGYLAGYYNNILSDRDSAIVYLEKGLEFDPGNEGFINNIKILKGQPANKNSGNTKPSDKAAAISKPKEGS
jgi:tetratricopeptide (TPR) repeat protein